MTTPYVYLVRCVATQQFYYGYRKGNVSKKIMPEEDLWKNYFTSSRAIKQLLKIYGVDGFETFIVFTNPDASICYWEEQRLIKDSMKNPLSLNFKYIDFQTGKAMFGGGQPCSSETRKKIGEALRGRKQSKETRAAQSVRQLGKKSKPRSEQTKKRISDSNKGRVNTKAIEAAAIANRGRKWPPGSRKPHSRHSIEGCENQSVAQKARWDRVRDQRGIITLSEETRRKISMAARSRIRKECPNCGKMMFPQNLSQHVKPCMEKRT